MSRRRANSRTHNRVASNQVDATMASAILPYCPDMPVFRMPSGFGGMELSGFEPLTSWVRSRRSPN